MLHAYLVWRSDEAWCTYLECMIENCSLVGMYAQMSSSLKKVLSIGFAWNAKNTLGSKKTKLEPLYRI